MPITELLVVVLLRIFTVAVAVICMPEAAVALPVLEEAPCDVPALLIQRSINAIFSFSY